MKTHLRSIAIAAALTALAIGGAQAATCHLIGTNGDDTLTATDPTCNYVIGGLGGNDTMTGEALGDEIHPGPNSTSHPGSDVMTGGGQLDAFIIDSSPGSVGTHADVITDFTHNLDIVFLFPVCHAQSVTCFFIGGSAFSGTAGEVRYSVTSGSTYGVLEADLDGDATADFQMKLLGAPTFTSGDINFHVPPLLKALLKQFHPRTE